MIKPKVFTELHHAGYCRWEVWIGTISIATIFAPHKGKRDYYIARCNFEMIRGTVDFSKDKHFETMNESMNYINERYAKLIKCLASHLHTIKPFKLTP